MRSATLGRTGERRARRDAGEHADVGHAPASTRATRGAARCACRRAARCRPTSRTPAGCSPRRGCAAPRPAHRPAARRRSTLMSGFCSLRYAPDAHQRAARAEAGDEVGDLGAVAPDLGAGALVVGPGVGVVAVLVEEAPLGMLLGHGLRPAHRAVRALRLPASTMISAPNTSSSCRRSIETFSGSTILIG